MRLILLILLSVCYADVIHVPADYSTIQEGIDASIEGDTVLVDQGIYFENLILDKTITLASHALYDDLTEWYEYSTIFSQYELTNDNIANTVINGSDATNGEIFQSVILINGADCIAPLIFGFTIKGGSGTQTEEVINDTTSVIRIRGGGILSNNALPEMHYNYILDNENNEDGLYAGGGMNTGTGIDFPENELGISNSNTRCEGDIDLSHNFYRENESLYGNTLATTNFDGFIDMSESIFDVYDCPDEEVTEVWVDIDEEVEITFEDGVGDLCSIVEDVWVSPDGDDYLNTGVSESSAFKTITHALQMVAPDSTNAITINLTEGTFSPSTTGETFAILMISNVNLIGQDEEVTILDAEQTDRVITMENCQNNIISDLTITGGSGYGDGHAAHGGGIYLNGSDASLNNIIISGNTTEGYAGGVYLYDSNAILTNIIIENSEPYGFSIQFSDATLNNIIIKENLKYGVSIGSGSTVHISNSEISNHTFTNDYGYGAGMIINGAEVIMENIVISNNVCIGIYNGAQGDQGGGAVSISGGAYVEIINLTMSDNIGSRNGGGIDVLNSTINISNSTFGNNITQSGGNDNGGGGISIRNSDANIFSSNFFSNISSGAGGAILIKNSNIELSDITINENESQYGGGISIIDTSICNMQNVDIMNNDSFVGGGIYIRDSYINFLYGKVNFNTATNTNGIRMYSSNGNIKEVEILSNFIYLEDSNPLMENILLQNYSVTPIYCLYSNPIIKNSIISDNSGGAISILYSNPIIINTTFSNNTGGSMGGNAPIQIQGSNPIFINSIIWDSDTTSFWDSYCLSSTITFINSLFDESEWVFNQSSWYDNGFNINVDPLFTDSGTGDYTLQEDSPCIDAGTSFLELDGEVILDIPENNYCDSSPDMGVYEYCPGCVDELACNYDLDANTDDGSCEYPEDIFDCCVCDCDGTLPEENYDCDDNCIVEIDCNDECGGSAVVDECGICGGEGAVYECGCTEMPDGDCDCNGNVVDECGVCGGDNSTCTGCTDETACNYNDCNGDEVFDDPCTIEDNELCNYPEEVYLNCDGSCINDSNGDGICDELSLYNGLIPEEFSIQSIYPNPFNPVTNIIYGQPEHINTQIIVYSLSGKQIETLVNELKAPGYYLVTWNASYYPSGVYLIRMESGSFTQTQKVVLVK